MASGGGATSSADMAAHQKNAHGLLLMGLDSADANWITSGKIDVTDYNANPSVLSFLFNEGLTAAGGNPFEGVSGYDPDDALSAIEVSINAFGNDIGGLSDIGDWSSFLTAAQANQDGQIPGMDVEATFNSIMANSIVQALSGVSTAWASAITAGKELAGDISATAVGLSSTVYEDAEAAARALADVAVIGRRSDADEDMAEADTAFSKVDATGAASTATAVASAADSARNESDRAVAGIDVSAKILADEVVVSAREDAVDDMASIDTAFGDVVTTASAAISDVFDDAIDMAIDKAAGISEGDSATSLSMSSASSQAKSDMADLMAQAADDAKVDAGAAVIQADTDVLGVDAPGETAGNAVYNAAEEDSTTAMTALHAAKAIALSIVSEAEGVSNALAVDRLEAAEAAARANSASEVLDIANSVGILGETVSDNMYNGGEDDSEAFLTSAETSVATMLGIMQGASEDDAESLISALEPVVRSTAIAATEHATNLAESTGTDIASNGESGLRTQALTGMAAIIAAINPQISGDASEAVTYSLQQAALEINIAMQCALDAVNSDMINSLVSSYRRRQLRTHLRSVNRFSGGMADINAVNSSAFVIGMALLESDFEQGVSDFQTQITVQLSQASLAHFGQVFMSILQEYMRTQQARFADYLSAYQLSGNSYEKLLLSTMPMFMQTYAEGVAQYLQATSTAYSESMRTGVGITQIQAGIVSASTDVRARILGQLAQTQLQAYTQTLVSQLDTRLGVSEATTKLAGVLAGAQSDLTGRVAEMRQRLVSDLIKLYSSAYDTGISSAMNTSSSMAQEGLKTSQSSGASKPAIIQTLVREYLQGYTNLIAQEVQAASAFGTLGDSREKIIDDDRRARVEVVQSVLGSYLSSYVGLVGQGNRTAEVFGGLGDSRLKVIADVLDKKLAAYIQDSGIGLQTFDKNLASNLRLMEQSLLSHFDGKIKTYLSNSSERSLFVRDGIKSLQAAQGLRLSGRQAIMGADVDLESRRIVASVDQYSRDLEIDAKSATWDMELFQGAGNVLSAVTGSVVQNAMKPSTATSAIAGMASGAGAGLEMGAKAGAILGPHTAAMLGGVGAIAGGIAGALQ